MVIRQSGYLRGHLLGGTVMRRNGYIIWHLFKLYFVFRFKTVAEIDRKKYSLELGKVTPNVGEKHYFFF